MSAASAKRAAPIEGEVVETGTEIVAAVTQNPGVVLLDSEKFDAFYERLKAETDKLVPDTTTAKGRDEIRSLAARVRSSKASIDKARLQLTKEWRDNVSRANEAGKVIETRLEGLAVEVRKPLTEWEEAEKARETACADILDRINAAAVISIDDTASGVRQRGAQVWNTKLDPEMFRDGLEQAEQVKANAVATLKSALARLEREEADRAELERLRTEAAERERVAAEKAAEEEAERRRAEQARLAEEARIAAEKAEAERLERIAREAEERARREAEEVAEAERQRIEREHAEALTAERRRAEEAENAARIERERVEAEEAARVAEAKRLADEQAKRDRDQAHRTAVKSAAKTAIMSCGADEETARKIVVAILANEIPNVTLRF